jgi:hypothetical protein
MPAVLHAQDTGAIHPAKTTYKAAATSANRQTALPVNQSRLTDTLPGTIKAAGAHTVINPASTAHPVALPSFTNHAFDHYREFTDYLLINNIIFQNTTHPLPDIAIPRTGDQIISSTDTFLFYIIFGVFFLLAVIRLSFTKYFSDLFRAFFNPTLSQRQLREQLSQTPFPALMLNIFFTLSVGLYLFLILRHFNYITVSRPLYLVPAFMLLIMVIYLVKYAFLRFSGWLFGYHEVTAGYVFTLYMVNKILGVILLPFILMLAFSTPMLAGIALNVSLIIIVLLFIYRYIRAYSLVKSQIFFNKFHFFIYLCGFEIAPILIIGKLVLIWLNGA